MIELFLPPIVRPPSATFVHRIEPMAGDDEFKELIPRKRKGQSTRAAYNRKYHTENRAQRLKQMKAYYEDHKKEHSARARKWRLENPEQYALIQKENQRRRLLREQCETR